MSSALALEGDVSALFFDSLLLACRRGDATEIVLALVSCQGRSATFLTVSGLVDGVSASIGFTGGTMISASARALASCQGRSATSLTVSGLVDGVSAGIRFVGGAMISGSARALGSSSLSDLADSFGAAAVS